MNHTKPAMSDYFASLMADMNAATSAAPGPLSRRTFLTLTGVLGGGLALGFGLTSNPAAANVSDNNGDQLVNAYVQIRPDGKIVILAPNPEIGQGVKTSMPMIVAEELDAAWEEVEVLQSPFNEKLYGRQFAGGSWSIPQNWDKLRQAGATAKAMLVTAAASAWGVPGSEIETDRGRLIHKVSGRSAGYGEFAQAAAQLAPPSSAPLKQVSEFKLLGRRITGVDNLQIVTGQPLFGIDQRQPDMLYACYVKAPATGGKVRRANLDHIKTLKGVKAAFVLEGNGATDELMPGIAIVANSTWAALKARRALEVEWDNSNAATDSWTGFLQQARQIAEQGPDETLVNTGDVAAAMSAADSKIAEGFYTHYFVSHAPLEPQNTLAHWKEESGSVEIWSNSQTPGRAVVGVANTLGISEDKVTQHQIRAGGGFGRRLVNDPVCEAAAISQHVKAPVLLQWTREDDMMHDFYRVGGVHAMKGAVDASGKMLAFQNHLITFTDNGRAPVMGGSLSRIGFPEGACANATLAQTMLPLSIPVGAWRAPGSNTIAWAQQSFLGELAAAANRDQLEFLLETLENMPEPRPMGMNKYRAMETVKLAAEKSGWGKLLPAGRGMGVAFYYSHSGHIAEVAEVSVDNNKGVTIHKVTVVGDVGPIVNMSGAEAMMQGSVVDGISTMMGLEITYEKGSIEQDNFHQYPLLRMNQVPEVDVHFIQSDNPPTGLGEPALPPLAPAVGNAIFMASGNRLRTLPISREGYQLV